MAALIPDVAFDAQSARCHVRLDSHAHTEHLPARADAVLVASPATIRFMAILRPKLQFATVLPIRPGETLLVPLPGAAAPLSVTALDALHCAGSLMFLVERAGTGRVLYTGDTRVEALAGGAEAALSVARGVDVMAADATFFHPRWRFPPRAHAVGEVLALIRERAGARGAVYIEADMLGCELLMEAVARAFRTPVHVVDRARYALFASIEALRPHLTDEAAASRFHFCQFQSLAFHAAVARPAPAAAGREEALYIRPSAQWFGQQSQGAGEVAGNAGPVLRDGVWHVLFSMHCSHAELAELVRFVRPRALVPLVPAAAPPSDTQLSLSHLLEPEPAAASASASAPPLSASLSFSEPGPSAGASASAPLLSAGLLPDAKTLGRRSSSGEGKRLRLHLELSDEEHGGDIDAFIAAAKRGRTATDEEPRLL